MRSIAEALAGDKTGCAVINLWDKQICEFDEYDVVEIRNGYTSLFKGLLRLNIGRQGTAEKVDKEIGEVNQENNLSETAHESFAYWSAQQEDSTGGDVGGTSASAISNAKEIGI